MLFTSADIAAWIGTFLWPFTRIGAMLAVAPIFGARMVPQRTRLVMALVLTWLIVPMLPPVPSLDPFSPAGVLVTVQQILIGLAIGFSIQLIFSALILAGQTVAMGMGLGFAQMVDPQNGVNVPVVGQYYVVISTLLFLAMNGHLALITVLMDSFQSLPIGSGMLGRDDMRSIAFWGARMFVGAAIVALPAVIAMQLVTLAFGVVSRAAPQLNIFGVGFPVILSTGFFIMMLAVPILLPQLERLMSDALTAVSLLGTGEH